MESTASNTTTEPQIPSTTGFPARISDLERSALEATYLDMRGHYKHLMLSRGRYRSLSKKNRAAMSVLEERLRAIADREASVRAEAYEMLQIVTDVIGELEDAGDDLVNEFETYQTGRRTFQGGAFLARLIQSVIRFINRWTRTKEQFQILLDKQDSIKNRLKEVDGTVS